MSFWKVAKDQAALNRMQDEQIHAEALREINAGIRRDGLWAKAVIESAGDETRAKISYLKLLVQMLRDEKYLEARLAEQVAEHERASVAAFAAQEAVRKAKEREAKAGFELRQRTSAEMKLQAKRCADIIVNGAATYETFDNLMKAVGGKLEPKGFIFGMHYVVSFQGNHVRIERYDDLREWFIINIIPLVER